VSRSDDAPLSGQSTQGGQLGVRRDNSTCRRRRARGARWVAAALVPVAVVVLGTAALGATRPQIRTQPRLDRTLLQEINALRASHGLRPLRLSRGLQAAASAHSCEMAADGYFDHASADGAFWQRVRSFYGTHRYRVWVVGENLMWRSPGLSARAVLAAWLRSPEHRANLLSPGWREIGIAAEHVARGPGLYGARPTTIVTADFGTRSR
jgi:uncharacterized protein YkwD